MWIRVFTLTMISKHGSVVIRLLQGICSSANRIRWANDIFCCCNFSLAFVCQKFWKLVYSRQSYCNNTKCKSFFGPQCRQTTVCWNDCHAVCFSSSSHYLLLLGLICCMRPSYRPHYVSYPSVFPSVSLSIRPVRAHNSKTKKCIKKSKLV